MDTMEELEATDAQRIRKVISKIPLHRAKSIDPLQLRRGEAVRYISWRPKGSQFGHPGHALLLKWVGAYRSRRWDGLQDIYVKESPKRPPDLGRVTLPGGILDKSRFYSLS